MADVGQTIEILLKLNFQSLSHDWVRNTWDQDFTICDELPVDVEEDLQATNFHLDELRSASAILTKWVGYQAEEGEGFWKTLGDNDLSHKGLVAFLFYFMSQGQKRVSNAVHKETGILAANIYLTLLRIPGSGAFKMFHPMLFEKSVTTFKTWSLLDAEPSGKKRKASSPMKSSQTKKRGRRKAKQNDSFDDEWDSDAEVEEENEMLNSQERNRLHKCYMKFLKDFVNFLASYTLRSSEQSVQIATQAMVDLAKMDPETFHGRFEEDVNVENMHSVPQLAYHGLIHLATGSHGDVTMCSTAVFKYLMPVILMLIGDNKATAAQTIPRSIQNSKDNAVKLVCYLIEKNENVLPSVRILLQHMCMKVPDKAEYRSKVAQAIIVILQKMPITSYSRMMEWIHTFSRTAKIGHRVFGLDIVCLLLEEHERTLDATVPEEYQIYATHSFYIQMLLSRCSDIASTVRARAIQGFAQCSASSEPLIKDTIRQIVTPRAANRPPLSRVVPTPDAQRTGSVIPAQADKEKEADKTSENNDRDGNCDKNTEESSEKDNTEVGDKTDSQNRTAVNGTNIRLSLGKTPGMTIRYDASGTPIVSIQLTPGNEITLGDGKGVMSLLQRRAGDEKVNVRKAALQALENIVKLESDGYNKENLKVIHDRTMDPALSVRKQAMASLTELLLEIPHDRDIMRAWLDGVFPLVMDRETSASEKCLELLNEIIIGNIVPYQRSKDACHKMVWRLLDEVAGNNGTDLRRFLNKAFCQWGRAGKLKTSLIGYLQTHIGTENNAGVWMILAEMIPFVPKLNHNFIVDYWRNHAHTAPESEFHVVNKVLTVLGFVAKHIPDSDIEAISQEFRDRLMKFDSPPELVSATVTTLHKLCKAESDQKAAQKRHNTWIVDLLRTCDSYLSNVILSDSGDTASDEDRIVKHLFTLGEVAQLCPAQIPQRVFMLVQSLIASPVIVGDASSQEYPYPQTQLQTQNPTPDQTQNTDKPQSENNDNQSENTDDQSESGDKDSQTQASEKQPGGSTQNSHVGLCQGGFTQTQLSQFRGSRMSTKVRAHAFITLGKLCLQHEDVAKKCVAALARELEVSTDPVIRNNVVIIMSDLCVRYTTLVDHYVSNISSCLRDDAPLVRKQTLTLLTHLLQEDFLKWKGSLFYRFVSTINDEDKDISSFADFCLAHLLVQRHPTMFFSHFVECVFHFNSYEDHNVYNKFPQTEREKKMFSLKGRNNFEKRMKIYRFMLEHMTDDQKFNLTAKLTNDILGAVVDGIIPLDSETSALLQDTLTILCFKEIKLSTMRSKPQDEVAENEQEMAAAVINAAKKTLISQVVKRNVIENIVPIVISLKHMLEKQRSPVLNDLMMYLRELMKDYKNEVKDIMSADRQLANEIEFDLRKFEEQQEELERQRLEQLRRRSRGVPAGTSPFGSPVAVNNKSPTQPGTPKQGAAGPGTPKAAPGTPVANIQAALNRSTVRTPQSMQKTPGGRSVRSMSTMAILNSARKAMEQAKRVSMSARDIERRPGAATPLRNSVEGESARVSSTGSSPSPQRSKRVGWADDVSHNQEDSSHDNIFKTPDRRAISTPYGKTSNPNITFLQNDSNVSMIPPSPIPSAIPMRLYPDKLRKSGSLTTAQNGEKATNPDVIHMFSPDKPTPKPRTWNVKSPAPRPRKPGIPSFSSSEDEDEEEENAPPSKGKNSQKRSEGESRKPAAEPLRASNKKSLEEAAGQVDAAASRKKENDKIDESLVKGAKKTRNSLPPEGGSANDSISTRTRTRRSVTEDGNMNDSIATRTRRSKDGATPNEPANQSRGRRSSSRKK